MGASDPLRLVNAGRSSAALWAALACSACGATGSARDTWNVVVVMTDDQRFDTLWAMPIVQEQLVEPGVTFDDAFVTTPMCCPTRASLLSGGYLPCETGVLTNEAPNGGFARFVDRDTLAQRLAAAGYATGLVGKYLNGFGDDPALPLPSGWTEFSGLRSGDFYTEWTLLEGAGGTVPHPVYGRGEYVTDALSERALDFVDAHADERFFLLVTPKAPHTPATPAQEDAESFSDFTWRGRGTGESDLSDKPAWMQDLEPFDPADYDASIRDQLRSLQSVDRMVGALVERLEERGILDETVVVFTSDHGVQWGEHNLVGKGQPYDESVRVPLVIRMPDAPGGKRSQLVSAALDLGATLQELAGLEPRSDGASLVPLLQGSDEIWRDRLLLEFASIDRPAWSGVVTSDWKYIEDATGELELYDRRADPFELESLDVRAPDLSDWLATHRGLFLTTVDLPPAALGQPYSAPLGAWGGVPPYRFSATGIPPGLAIAGDQLVGIPVQNGTFILELHVEDSGASRWTGAPHGFSGACTVVVGDDAAERRGEPLVEVVGRVARILVRTSRPAAVRVRYSTDANFDDHARYATVSSDGASATAVLDLDREAPIWYWRLDIEGVPDPGGARRIVLP
jgi:arylsulfatase A-like enzyme